MKHIIMLCTALILCTTGLVAQTNNPESYIICNGNAEMEITPNKFIVTLHIDESDTKGKVSADEQFREVVKALKSVDIDTNEALRLKDNSSDYFRRGTSLRNKVYEIHLTTTKQLSDVFRVLNPLNLSALYISSVQRTNAKELFAQMREQAILDARNRAETLASTLGQSIGACYYISDTHYDQDTIILDRSGVRVRGLESLQCAVVEIENAVADDFCEPQFSEATHTYTIQAKFYLLP